MTLAFKCLIGVIFNERKAHSRDSDHVNTSYEINVSPVGDATMSTSLLYEQNIFVC